MTETNDNDTEPLADRSAGLSDVKRALLERRLGRRPQVQTIPRHAGNDPAPLSSAQRRFWILEQLERNNAAYYIAGSCRLLGPLQPELLRRALKEVLQRHEALRTTFPTVEGEPFQNVAPSTEPELPLEEVGADGEAAWLDAVRRRASQEVRVAIDLQRGPVFRVRLLRRNPQDHVLVIVIHHIACDGWSLGVLLREWFALYHALVSGQPAPLPVLPIRYSDYARWEQARLRGDDSQRQLAYWRERLDGLQTLYLLTDRPRPPVMTYTGGLHNILVPVAVTEALKAYARREKCTPFIATLAVFKLLLHRLSLQDDIVVGTPIAGRRRAELEGLVGLFINSLALRTQVSGELNFQELLARVRETALGAYANDELPFEYLVEALNPERDRSRNPLYQVMFRFNERSSVEWPSIPDLRIVPLPHDYDTAQLDLTYSVTETPQGLTLDISYNTDLFQPATIQRLAGYYVRLLQAAVAHPQTRIGQLPMLDAGERQQLLVDWNRTEVAYPEDHRLHALIEAQVDRGPEAVAVQFEDQALSYRELDRRANQLARHLRNLGVGPGTLVGVFMERSLEMVVALYAILKAGGAYVPLDPEYPADRIAFMLQDAGAPVLLSQQHLRAQLPPHPAAVVCVDSEWPTIARHGDARPPDVTTPEDIAYAIYTSGSTGRPKGVLNRHRGIVNRLLWMQDAYRLTAADAVLQKTPFSFDVSVWEFFWPLLSGARLVVAKPGGHRDPAYLSGLIAAHHITTLHFVPSMLNAYLDYADLNAACLKRVIVSGEALSYELQERFFQASAAALHNLYGPTEAAVDVSSWACRRDDGRRLVPIGRPIANTRLYILDRELQPVPIGVAGELHIAGVQVAQGYLNRPELTAEKFIPDIFGADSSARMYKTGDLARYLPDGNIEYLGRIDNQVKLRGFRIELGEIEAVLGRHEQVRAAVVTLREDTPGDQRLVAYVVLANDRTLTTDQLHDWAAASLPAYMVPASFVVLETLPLTASGKIDRQALPLPPRASARAVDDAAMPNGELEQAMARIWGELLDVDHVQARDTFFDLGGHSLLSIKAVERFERETGIRVAPTELINQTLRQIITGIEMQRAPGKERG